MELITGATASLVQLQLYNEDNELLCELDDDAAPLKSYPVKNGYRIHVRKLAVANVLIPRTKEIMYVKVPVLV